MPGSLHPATFAARYVDLRKAMTDGKVTKTEVKKLILPHLKDDPRDTLYTRTLGELSRGSTSTGTGRVRATQGAQALLSGALRPTPPPKTLDVWANRMPGTLRATDRVTLGTAWSSAPVSVIYGGKSYKVAEAQVGSSGGLPSTRFDVFLPPFPAPGAYAVTVTLANGKKVPVTLNVDFAY